MVFRALVWAIRNLRAALKFLAFKEDNPTHKVCVNEYPLIFGGVFAIIFGMYFIVLAMGTFGIIGAVFTYLAYSVAVLEVAHIIWDRPQRL